MNDTSGFSEAVVNLCEAFSARREEILDKADNELAGHITGFYGPTVELGGVVEQMYSPPVHMWSFCERNAEYELTIAVRRVPNQHEIEAIESRGL